MRGEIAKKNFLSGMNCCQAVLLAFSDLTGLDEATALKMAAPFGGGVGRMREVCGTVSGMCMVLGMLFYDAKQVTVARGRKRAKNERFCSTGASGSKGFSFSSNHPSKRKEGF